MAKWDILERWALCGYQCSPREAAALAGLAEARIRARGGVAGEAWRTRGTLGAARTRAKAGLAERRLMEAGELARLLKGGLPGLRKAQAKYYKRAGIGTGIEGYTPQELMAHTAPLGILPGYPGYIKPEETEEEAEERKRRKEAEKITGTFWR
jgi:hypothetical protein